MYDYVCSNGTYLVYMNVKVFFLRRKKEKLKM